MTYEPTLLGLGWALHRFQHDTNPIRIPNDRYLVLLQWNATPDTTVKRNYTIQCLVLSPIDELPPDLQNTK